MLNTHDQAVSALPVAVAAPASPLIEDWDTMMRALRQRIGVVATTSRAAQSADQRQTYLGDCAQALVQMGDHLGRLDLSPAARQQREHELQQGAHLLARALQTGNRPAPAG